LTGLTDVTLTNPTYSQVLAYNGSVWVNSAVTSSGGGTTGGTTTFLGLTDTFGSFTNGRILYESSSAVVDSSGLTYSNGILSIDGSIESNNIIDAYITGVTSFTGNTDWSYGKDYTGAETFYDGQEYYDGTFIYKQMDGTFVKWPTNLVETIGFEIRGLATGQTFCLELDAPYDYIISGLTYKTDVDTCVFDVKINTTNIGNLSSVTGTTAKTTNWVSGANLVNEGDSVYVYISGLGTASVLDGSLKNIRISN